MKNRLNDVSEVNENEVMRCIGRRYGLPDYSFCITAYLGFAPNYFARALVAWTSENSELMNLFISDDLAKAISFAHFRQNSQ